MGKIVAVTMNGWSASSRSKDERMSELVERTLEGRFAVPPFSVRALLFPPLMYLRTRKALRYIRKHGSKDRALLLCGKSLGSWKVLTELIPKLGKLRYSRVALLSVDPCTPMGGDLTPNLNDYRIIVKGPIGKGINLYAENGRIYPAGATVKHPSVINVGLSRETHSSIVDSPQVSGSLQILADWCEGKS